jgi:pimeloyl-ACP methyl ester carboxylesterase
VVLCDTLVGIEPPAHIRPAMEATERATRDLPQAQRVLGPTTLARDRERTLLYLQIASFNSVNVRTVKGRFERHTPAELAATCAPILFIAGEEDVLFEASTIRAMSAATLGSRYVEISDAGHSAYFEMPNKFNELIIGFLDEINFNHRVT